MAIKDALARLFWRGSRAVSWSASYARAYVLGMGPTELYRKQPALRAVVSFLADNVAGVPLKCYVREADDDRPRDTTSDLALLLQWPSAGMTTHELVRALVSDYLIYGNSMMVVLPDAGSPSGWSARHIPWSWVESRETENGFDASSYDVSNPYTGGRATFDASCCIRFQQYDPAGTLDASSPIEALREVLSEQVSAWNFRNSVWRNGGRVSSYLYRPRDTPWGDGARDRFSKSWKNRFSGEEGTDTGGTPLLEDGMELRTVQFNAREAEWAEATRLSREDVAAVYHVNPSQIWHTESQTYASAKDNARALYADTLAPIMNMVEERLNAFLVPMLGLDPSAHYVEFDLSAKLAASFEEQASVLQSSVGGPFVLRNEARARMNLPALPEGDKLIVPLNVTEGGLASPNDTDPTRERYNAALAQPETPPGAVRNPRKDAGAIGGPVAQKSGSGGENAPFDGPRAVRFRSKASSAAVRDLEAALQAFYERQATSMANSLAAIPWDEVVLVGKDNDVFRGKPRWVRELAEDLMRTCELPATEAARQSLLALGADPDALDAKALGEIVGNLCHFRADDVVQSTFTRLLGDLDELWAQGKEGWTPENVRSCVQGSYRHLMESRIERNARSMATAIANAGTVEGARQSGVTAEKEWVTGPNARRSHAAMNGKRVAIDRRFFVGAHMARWPGDTSLPAHESCNCNCRIDIVAGETNVTRERRIQERVESAREIGEGLYEGTPQAILARAVEIDAELKHIYRSTQNVSTDRNAYSRYASYVMGFASNAPITIEDFATIEGKELQIASWFSKLGVEVHFRNHNKHENKSDVLMYDMLFDFKRITSPAHQQISTVVKKKLRTQGPGFVVDLSGSSISLEDALMECAHTLEKERVERMLIIKDARLIEVNK